MQVATSPLPFKLPLSISESSSFKALRLPSSSSSRSSFSNKSFQTNALVSPSQSPNIDAVTNTCVDIIHLLDASLDPPDSTSAKIVPASTTSHYQSVSGFPVSNASRPTPKNLEISRRKRRAVFTVDPDDTPHFSRCLLEADEQDYVYGTVQESNYTLPAKQKDETTDQIAGVNCTETQPPQTKEPPPLQNLKQWHALTEIVSTEVSYVHDLRKLAYVYFPALLVLPLEPSISTAVQELGDNVSQLLDHHERFLKALHLVKKHGTSVESLDDAIERIAQLFISRASHFDLYQLFCSSQPEINTLLGVERRRLKTEWRLFEQQCAADWSVLHDSGTALSNLEVTDVNSDNETGPSSPVFAEPTCLSPPSPSPKSRVPSSSTLAVLNGSASSRGVSEIARPGLSRSLSVDAVSMAAAQRLRFHDYLIKPVQRICKYPMLLEKLQQSKTHSERIEMVLMQALLSMNAVSRQVDEARRIREETIKTRLILERIETHSIITGEFLRSLGNCAFAGCLDVAYHHHVYNPIDPPIRVRYLAAFLFSGGYLLFAKVSKNRTYRIKHWFNATLLELVDIPEEEALVPHAFRLSRLDHHFEIVTAYSSEKELWMKAIKECICKDKTWVSEPPSSLEIMAHIIPRASTSHSHIESTPVSPSKEALRTSSNDHQQSGIPSRPSMRIRTTIVNSATKLFSMGDGPPLLLKRSTAADRDLVDREMKDVQSASISEGRLQAHRRNEIMFPPPKFAQPAQAMAMATTNKLMRRGSWLLTRTRNPSSPGLEQEDTVPVVTPNRWIARVGPSVAPNLSALRSEPECIDGAEEFVSSSGHEPTITGSETAHDADEGIPIESPKTPRRRRQNSFAASLKGLVRRGKSKRNSCQHIGDKTETTVADVSPCRRRVSSAPPSPPQTQLREQLEAVNLPGGSDLPTATNLDDIFAPLEAHQTSPIPHTDSASPLKPKSSLKRMIFRH